MNARLRRICIAAAIVVVSLIILLIVGYSQLMSYLQGNDFRQRMVTGIQHSTGATTVEINSNLTINGSNVSVEGISVAGLNNIREAKAAHISADIDRTALFSKRLHLRKVRMEEASLALSTGSAPTAETPAKKTRKKKRKTIAKASKQPEVSKNDSFINTANWELDLLECQDADLHLEHNGKPYQLLGANITALPAPRIGRNAWQLTAENARLRTPFTFLRESSIKSTTLLYQGNTVDATECRIMLSPGEMRLKAHYDLRSLRWSADMQINKADLHRILNDDWKKRATGELYGRLTLTGKGSDPVTGTGAFSIQNGVLEGLPFLSQLPVGNTYPYRSIELEKADCQVLFPYDSDKIKNAWLFDKINLRSRDGAFVVNGHVLIGTDRRLGGTLTIGIPRSTVESFPLAQEVLTGQFFTATGNDAAYLWVNMNLSGTIDKPQEDLSIRIATLTGNRLGELLKEIPKGNASSLLNLLLQQKKEQPAGTDTPSAKPQPGNLLQNATNAAGSLLQSLF